MTEPFSRRGAFAVFATAATALGLGARANAAAPDGYYKPQKVVYQNSGGPPDDTAFFKRLVGHVRNHFTALGSVPLEVRVVNYASGILVFSAATTDKAIAADIDEMRAKGVRFLMCANSLRARNIDWRTLYGVKEDDVVPAGVAELGRLQGMGFAYIRL